MDCENLTNTVPNIRLLDLDNMVRLPYLSHVVVLLYCDRSSCDVL